MYPSLATPCPKGWSRGGNGPVATTVLDLVDGGSPGYCKLKQGQNNKSFLRIIIYMCKKIATFPFMVFLFYFSAGSRFEITKPRGLCSDIGKKVIDNLAECEDAVIELGGHVNKHRTNGVPKGCSSRGDGDFNWNKYKGIETSKHRNEYNRAICTKRGN